MGLCTPIHTHTHQRKPWKGSPRPFCSWGLPQGLLLVLLWATFSFRTTPDSAPVRSGGASAGCSGQGTLRPGASGGLARQGGNPCSSRHRRAGLSAPRQLPGKALERGNGKWRLSEHFWQATSLHPLGPLQFSCPVSSFFPSYPQFGKKEWMHRRAPESGPNICMVAMAAIPQLPEGWRARWASVSL